MAPTEVLAEQHELTMRVAARRADGARRGHAARRAAGAGGAPHQPDTGARSGGASPTACSRARSTSSSAPTRSIYGGVEFARLGVAVIDEQHRFGVEQRDLLPGEGRRARRARDDRDADPAHRGDAHLRRPRQDRAAPAAGGSIADRDRRWSAAARSSGCRCTSGCGRRSPRVGRRTSCARSSRAPTSSRRRPPPRSSSGCAPRSSPTCASACCTARCRRPTRRPRCARSAAGEIDVLVATTVIEVGVDVPNATVMVDRGRRPLRSAAAPPAARPHRARRAPRRAATCSPSRPRRRARRAWRRWWSRATASSWPSATSRSAARARCSASARPGWTDLKLGRLPQDEPIVFEARGVAERDPRRRPRPRAARAAARRGARTSSATRSSSCSRADAALRGASPATRGSGRRLVAPKGGDAPDDRPREGGVVRIARADRIDDAAVLDLYAGSGALGDRGALAGRGARGAGRPRRRRASVAVRANLATTGFDDRRPRSCGRRSSAFLRRRRAGGAVRPRVPRPALRRPVDRGRGRAGAAARPAPWLASGRDRRRRATQGGRHRSSCPTAGVPRRSGPTAIRSWWSRSPEPRPAVAVRGALRGHRPLPGLVRSRHQRSPRHHRADRAPLRRRDRRGDPQPAEDAVALHPRGAPGDAGRGDRPPRRTSGSSSSRACWSSSPRTTGPSRS